FIHQRLLENKTLDLETAYSQAYTLHPVHHKASAYVSPFPVAHAAALVPEHKE
ncbi:hypothetical protein SK128_003362, partial [Halocaridina rubra]